MCRAQCVLVLALVVGLADSWDIAITAGDRIEFYTDNGIKTETVRFESKTLTALAYDEVHNTLLYVDKQTDNDAICGYSMSYGDYKCYVERNGRNIQGLAFDPVTEILFFTDTKERSINWFSFKPESKNNVYGNLLIKIDDGTPTDIAVDSCRGYIYWVNPKLPKPIIERARFNGTDREVVITANYKSDILDIGNVAIDQQKQKMIWLMPTSSSYSYTYSADLNGKNSEGIILWSTTASNIHPNSYAFSKQYLYAVGCSTCNRKSIWRYPKISNYPKEIFKVESAGVVGIVANYKMKDQFRGISDCHHGLSNYETDESFKIAREQEAPHCVHGAEVTGLPLCKCTAGYTGERCEHESAVCANYCLHGNCSYTEQGLPICRCTSGYSGERCEVDVCNGYCSNSGNCSLNDDNQPFCQCQGDYLGHRCEIAGCLNYCLQGTCSLNVEGLPECRCDAGYSGERCEINVCYQYCSNNGTCSLNEEDAPVCECVGEYEGERCDVPVSHKHGDGSLHEEEAACQCDGSHEGPGQETDKNETSTSTSRYYTAERNVTLADLLANWKKPVATISVVVEVKTNK